MIVVVLVVIILILRNLGSLGMGGPYERVSKRVSERRTQVSEKKQLITIGDFWD